MKKQDQLEMNESNKINGGTLLTVSLLLILLNLVLGLIYNIENTPIHVPIAVGLISTFMIMLAAIQRLKIIEKPSYYALSVFIPIVNLIFIIWLSMTKEIKN
jgi:uncharacterized membrane protein YhaH (DUF805 family)